MNKQDEWLKAQEFFTRYWQDKLLKQLYASESWFKVMPRKPLPKWKQYINRVKAWRHLVCCKEHCDDY